MIDAGLFKDASRGGPPAQSLKLFLPERMARRE
jgi:hypothetical protein